jgi:hypothetical protein
MIHGERRRPYCRLFMDWAGWRKRPNIMVNKSIFRANSQAEMRKVTHLITVLLVHFTVSEGWSIYCAQVIMQSMTGQLKFLACNKIGRIIKMQTYVDTKASFIEEQSRVFLGGGGELQRSECFAIFNRSIVVIGHTKYIGLEPRSARWKSVSLHLSVQIYVTATFLSGPARDMWAPRAG